MEEKFWRIWAVAWLCNVVSFLGVILAGLGFEKSRRFKNPKSDKA